MHAVTTGTAQRSLLDGDQPVHRMSGCGISKSMKIKAPSFVFATLVRSAAWLLLLALTLLTNTNVKADSIGAATDVAAESSAVAESTPGTTCTVGADGSQECLPIEASVSADGISTIIEPTTHDDAAVKDDDDENDDAECKDEVDQCGHWASLGECQANPSYMLSNCAHSCSACANISMLKQTKLYGKRQVIAQADAASLERIEAMHRYMTETVFVNASFAKVKSECKNRDKQCAHWASIGECEKNRNFMLTQCSPACLSCEMIDFEVRCPFDRNATKVWEKPGDLERFFERLLERTMDHPEYNPTLFSGPAAYTSSLSPSTLLLDNSNTVPIVDGPWVVTLENVLSDEECERLIQLGHVRGYERSKDVGAKKFDGTFDSHLNPRRTSTNAWCNDECYDDPLVQQLTARIENLIGIPSNNSEYWQLLRYEETQQYEHHDFIDYQLDRPEGVRILTVFFYLNTVEAGGGTRFPGLNDLTVKPVKGRVLIWPSVLNENPDLKDPRTNHQALPVEKGIKYGANAWVHQRDYKTPHNNGCV